jgi:dimethylargininase
VLTALTRAVSPTIGDCQLTYITRQPIDFDKAEQQHRMYELYLSDLGLTVVSLAAEAAHPDAVFVEDAAVVVDEVAAITNMGSDKRRSETESLVSTLSQYRKLSFLKEPAVLDGGDVLRIGRTFYAGISSRTNEEGVAQLRQILSPYGYEVKGVKVKGCLHLKTGCTFIGNNTILANPSWVDANQFPGFEILEVPASEPWAANSLLIRDTILFPLGFPQTTEMLREKGFNLKLVDISELMKAEAGLTCMSLIFENRVNSDQ